MNTINDKKERRMIINNTKATLKKNAKTLKQDYNIDVPADILNMENGAFYVFVTDVAYPVMKYAKTTDPEIIDVVAKLQACVRAYKYYNHKYEEKI